MLDPESAKAETTKAAAAAITRATIPPTSRRFGQRRGVPGAVSISAVRSSISTELQRVGAPPHGRDFSWTDECSVPLGYSDVCRRGGVSKNIEAEIVEIASSSEPVIRSALRA